MDDKLREWEAKAWCFDRGITAKEMETAWSYALKTNEKAQLLYRSGKKNWYDLNTYILGTLHKDFLPKAIDPTESA